MFLGSLGYSGYSSPNKNNLPLPTPPTSPTRTSVWGSALSPFRNTNMPLQDITMNQTLPLVNGTNVKLAGKSSSGVGIIGSGTGIVGSGRTMKEYEDKLCALQKENFNLKLRIYFLEERMGITSADEDAIKKNIELKVEIESLKKELVEKQELLSQAATAFEVIEEQKEAFSRNQAQYQLSLQNERERIAHLEKELAEYRERMSDASIYYKESFGITPEQAIENTEKLHQMEEFVASLDAEVKQLTGGLEEERNWAQELENERDQLKERLESEIELREKLTTERDREIYGLREKIKELEEQAFMKDSIAQQYKNELAEKERLIKEKMAILEDKCRACEDLNSVSEKRKKQIDQLRLSVKSRDDALTDLNNKHRALLSQFENGYTKRISPPNSPPTTRSLEDPYSPRSGLRSSCLQSPTRSPFDWEINSDRSSKTVSPLRSSCLDNSQLNVLSKEVEERDRELQRQETAKKQLILKLCNVQQSAEATDQKLKKLESDHEKALKMIQGFMERQQQLEDKHLKKDRRIVDLELEITRLRGCENSKSKNFSSIRRSLSSEITDNPERDNNNQQRFEEMESKINDLRDEIDTIKAEKIRLEKQIQVESEELQEKLQTKEQKIEVLEYEKNSMKEELHDKILELNQLKEVYDQENLEFCNSDFSDDKEKLRRELFLKSSQLHEKNQKIDQLEKELQVKTQNLQQLVNTELWSKNKEIAKLHNHMTTSQLQDKSRNKSDFSTESSSSQLNDLVKELNDIGISVKFTDEVIQLNYHNGIEPIDVKTMTEYIHKLMAQKNELEKEVDYLKWLKLVSKPDIAAELDGSGSETERVKKYCEVLRMHLKDLVKFMKDTLKNTDNPDTISNEHKKIVLDVLLSSKILSDDFVLALEGMSMKEIFERSALQKIKMDGVVRKSRSDNILDYFKNQACTLSDSEAFSEPDRTVSLARIGLQETQQKSSNRLRFSKYTKTCSDSEDSLDYIPYHKTYQSDLNDVDTGHHIQELKETNNLIFTELNALRSDLVTKISFDSTIDDKLLPLITKLEKSQRFCEKLQNSLEKRIHECQALKRESKQNSVRKAHLEKKIIDVENMVVEMNKQKAEVLQYKENAERKSAEMLITLNKENDTLRAKILKLEEDNEAAKLTISNLTKELDHLTLLHSQILVENTKLTNEKLRLEQEVRKTEGRYDMAVRTLQDKFNKEVTDLNQINDSHRARMQELEAVNKELRRHVVVCETSDSAPSSSGISSVPTEAALKQTCNDIIQEYHSYNGSQYWLPLSYTTSTGRSKSSCSPDLGIESDAAMTSMRPLKDTLKITECMTNLLSDDENCNSDQRLRDLRNESALAIEGLDEVETLRQENEALKKRLMKTRKALEETFEHLSASNKSKKHVEKAITQQLKMTKNILKKTRTFEEPFDN